MLNKISLIRGKIPQKQYDVDKMLIKCYGVCKYELINAGIKKKLQKHKNTTPVVVRIN